MLKNSEKVKNPSIWNSVSQWKISVGSVRERGKKVDTLFLLGCIGVYYRIIVPRLSSIRWLRKSVVVPWGPLKMTTSFCWRAVLWKKAGRIHSYLRAKQVQVNKRAAGACVENSRQKYSKTQDLQSFPAWVAKEWVATAARPNCTLLTWFKRKEF